MLVRSSTRFTTSLDFSCHHSLPHMNDVPSLFFTIPAHDYTTHLSFAVGCHAVRALYIAFSNDLGAT